MINLNTIYNVTGRYMDGQKVIGYHLVGEDGSQAKEYKDRVIWLIGKGLVSNMRLQIGTDKEVIIRGKGINLNSLPVYDEGKQQFRNDNASQIAANSSVSVKKSTVNDANQMGQYKIVKRIMIKNKCIGYEVQDHSGRVTRKKRDDVIQLAIGKLLNNAVANRYTKADGTIDIILRGVNCDLAKLPVLIVNEQGKIVDQSKDTANLTVRAAYMKHSGTVHDTIRKVNINFKFGDFIICNPSGEIVIKSKEQMEKEYTKDSTNSKAICDDYLSNLSKYYIEIFGSKTVQITPNMVQRWVIFKPVA